MIFQSLFGKSNNQDDAKKLYEKAKSLGQNGKYSEAIKLFIKASQVDPKNPQIFYDLAYTYLLNDNSKASLDNYKKTDTLSPQGFFTCKTAIWSLEKEKSGDFPNGTYKKYIMHEWI